MPTILPSRLCLWSIISTSQKVIVTVSSIECCVCYETSPQLTLTCHHPLCRTCGNKIIANNVVTCPMCRGKTSFPPKIDWAALRARETSFPPKIDWAALRARDPLPLHYCSFRAEGPPMNNVPACPGTSKGARRRRNRRLTLLSPSHPPPPPPPSCHHRLNL